MYSREASLQSTTALVLDLTYAREWFTSAVASLSSKDGLDPVNAHWSLGQNQRVKRILWLQLLCLVVVNVPLFTINQVVVTRATFTCLLNLVKWAGVPNLGTCQLH